MDESYAAFQALNDLASRIGFHGIVRGFKSGVYLEGRRT